MAYWKPDCMAPPIPRLNGCRTTVAPAASASATVRSVEPSSITTTSKSGASRAIAWITRPTEPSSL